MTLEGLEIIRKISKTLPRQPGVYQMLNEKGDILYIGKAKNIYNRVKSYLSINSLTRRIQRMVSLTTDMNFFVTNTEFEAIILECNLIKKNPQERWLASWETNRGCPFSCAYCDWGSATGSKQMGVFPQERLKEEMEWFSHHSIEYIFCCDANFGMFKSLSKEKQKQLLKKVPNNKHGHIKNIYNAIEFIINSDYVNNSEIKIDGGL